MAQLVASAVAAGGYAAGSEATGPRYAEESYAGSPSTVATEPAPAPRLRRVLVGTAVAVLIGGVLGIGGTWLAGLSRDAKDGNPRGGAAQGQSAGPDRPGSGGTPPAPSDALPRPTATPTARVNNAIAPVITRLQASGTSVVVTWQDNSGGRAVFVVVQAGSQVRQVSGQLAEGTTRYRVDGLDPATAPYCFVVLAFVAAENGPESGGSPRRCVEAAR
jgi:hypothetical protein